MERNYSRSKKIKRALIIVLVLMTLVFIGPRVRIYLNKNKIINIVRDNQELLNTSVHSGVYKNALEINGIKDIHLFTTDQGNIYIDYFCNGFGIVPSSIYYGFYYYSIDEPIGFQGTNVKFNRKGNGWYWSQIDGDNWCYVEKIDDHWYYYEAGFQRVIEEIVEFCQQNTLEGLIN